MNARTEASAPSPIGCWKCEYLPTCGGLEGALRLFGCFDHCLTRSTRRPAMTKCAEFGWTCPNCRPDEFRRRWRQAGGYPHIERPWPQLRVPSTTTLPRYVPKIHHGDARWRPFEAPVVAISAYDFLGGLPASISSYEELLRHYSLAPGTEIILSGVAPDRLLERYWAKRRGLNLAERFRRLGISVMTSPNYSFFTDAPRVHTKYNARRLQLTTEELSAAGVAVAPHLNAITTKDWDVWANLLRNQPQIQYVAKEFQTGLRFPELGRQAVDALAVLQDRAGRPLHPLLFGSLHLAREVAARFTNFTFIDSTPFMKTMKRQRLLSGHSRPRWKASHSQPNELLDDLLQHNADTYGEWVRRYLASPNSPEIH
jgi:hypothetical protein